jgi:hypothetical protein
MIVVVMFFLSCGIVVRDQYITPPGSDGGNDGAVRAWAAPTGEHEENAI